MCLCFRWTRSIKYRRGQSASCLLIAHYSGFADLFFPCCSHVSLSDAKFPAAPVSPLHTAFLSPRTQHRVSVLVAKPLHPVFLMPLLKKALLFSPSKKLVRRRSSYSIGSSNVDCLFGEPESPPAVPNNSELEKMQGAETFSSIDQLFILGRK